jgi:hypothetical protein
MAESLDGGNLSPWAWAGIGAIAGTVARANDWIGADNRVDYKMLTADLSSSGFVVIVSVLTADWMQLPGPYAAGFASIATLVGIRALRDTALKVIEIGLSGFAKRIGADPPAPAAPEQDQPPAEPMPKPKPKP